MAYFAKLGFSQSSDSDYESVMANAKFDKSIVFEVGGVEVSYLLLREFCFFTLQLMQKYFISSGSLPDNSLSSSW